MTVKPTKVSAKQKLSKLLAKSGIENVEDMSEEEKVTFQRYKSILSGEAVTTDSIKEFCRSQLRVIESKSDGITPLTNIQQACIHVYVNILKAIEAPEAERSALEQHLNQLINT